MTQKKMMKSVSRALSDPPVGPVTWVVRLRRPRPGDVLDKVISQSAFGAWRGSVFYRLGYSYSDVLCELEG